MFTNILLMILYLMYCWFFFFEFKWHYLVWPMIKQCHLCGLRSSKSMEQSHSLCVVLPISTLLHQSSWLFIPSKTIKSPLCTCDLAPMDFLHLSPTFGSWRSNSCRWHKEDFHFYMRPTIVSPTAQWSGYLVWGTQCWAEEKDFSSLWLNILCYH